MRSRLGEWRRRRKDIRAAIELSRLGLPFTPWPQSALAPSALLTVINDVAINDRRTVVELGAGVSTIYLAKVIAGRGGRLISVESDPAWAAVVRDLAGDARVGDALQMVEAPLERSEHSLDDGLWYAEDRVLEAIAGCRIDLLLVDGPPAHGPRTHLARYPALPLLKDFLADRCSIFLDDISRPGEREVAERWSELVEMPFVNHYALCGMAVAQRGSAFHIYL
jgi:hypothetical protein